MAFTHAVRRAAVVLLAGLCWAAGPKAQNRPASAGDERLAAARAQLRTLLGDTGANGRIAERSRGNLLFSPAQTDLPDASIKNTSEVGALAVGPLLRVWGTLDDNGALTIRRYTLAAAAQRPPESAESALLPDAVREASTRILATINGALRPGAMSVEERTLDGPSTQSQSVKSDLIKIRAAYRAALGGHADPKQITAIVRSYADTRVLVADAFNQSDEHKALYRSAENYDPWRYDVIFRQARAVVAIGEPGDSTARCSGVLIAADLVLTAAHCFGGVNPKRPDELEVWFGYSRVPAGPMPPVERRPIDALIAPAPTPDVLTRLMAGSFNSQLLDYAIVRFRMDGPGPLTPQGVVPQCLRSTPLAKNDPVYVIGYPEGAPQMVHDSARVYLPFRVLDGDAFFRLRLDVEADLLASPRRAEFMRQFDSSYETTEATSGVTYRFLYHIRDGNQPRMGIVANTFRGDSGGPVFDRARNQCVAGILVSGADDTGERINVSWERHEAVLPTTAIVKDAARFLPSLGTTVKIE